MTGRNTGGGRLPHSNQNMNGRGRSNGGRNTGTAGRSGSRPPAGRHPNGRTPQGGRQGMANGRGTHCARPSHTTGGGSNPTTHPANSSPSNRDAHQLTNSTTSTPGAGTQGGRFFDPTNKNVTYSIPGFTTAAELLKTLSPPPHDKNKQAPAAAKLVTPPGKPPSTGAAKLPDNNSANNGDASGQPTSSQQGDEFGPFELTDSQAKAISEAEELELKKAAEKDNETTADTGADPTKIVDLSNESDDTKPPPRRIHYSAFPIPAEEYKFSPQTHQEPPQPFIDKMNKELNFHEVIKTLEPKAQMTLKMKAFRAQMQGISLIIDSAKTSFVKLDAIPNYVYKSVNIQPKFYIPAGAEFYPDSLLPVYKVLEDALADAAATFRLEASTIIHRTHELKLFQLRLDRVNLFLRHLVEELGQYHAAVYRAMNPPKTSDGNSNLSNISIAKKGIRRVIDLLDKEMLEYLDINRVKLGQVFESTYKDNVIPKLSATDHRTADFVTHTALSYIKAATCAHYKKRVTDTTTSAAMASVAADMERKEATNAMTDVQKAIAAQAELLPKDPKTLKDFITRTVDSLHKERETREQSERKRPSKATQKQTPPQKKARTHPKGKTVGKTPPTAPTKGVAKAQHGKKRPPQPAANKHKQPKPDRRRSKTKKSQQKK
jgi:hypothetical protein